MEQSTTTRRLAPLLAIAIGAAAACSGKPDLRVEGAEARSSPSIVGVAAIFLTVSNAGDGDDALVGAQVDAPGAIARLHGVEGGRMVEQDRAVVPARGVLALHPGGPHLMVFNLPQGAGAGTVLALRLRFEKSGERETSVRIGEGDRAVSPAKESSPTRTP